MTWMMTVAGFFSLAFLILALFFKSTWSAFEAGFFSAGVILLILGLLILFRLYLEKVQMRERLNMRQMLSHDQGPTGLKIFIHLFLGAGVTFFLSHRAGLGPVLASCMIGITASLWLKPMESALFCGSFVGMVCAKLFPSYLHLFLAAMVAGLLYLFSQGLFEGYGGKLGAIAFWATTYTAQALGISLSQGAYLPSNYLLFASLIAVVAAVCTYILKEHTKAGPVMSSALTGLLAYLFLVLLFKEQGETLAMVAYAASFAGMSSRQKLPHVGWVVLTGIFVAVVFTYAFGHYTGTGGKMGAIALGCTLASSGCVELKRLYWY